MHFPPSLFKFKIFIIKITKFCFAYFWSKILSLSLYSMPNLSKTTSPQKLLPFEFKDQHPFIQNYIKHDFSWDVLRILKIAILKAHRVFGRGFGHLFNLIIVKQKYSGLEFWSLWQEFSLRYAPPAGDRGIWPSNLIQRSPKNTSRYNNNWPWTTTRPDKHGRVVPVQSNR